MELLRVAALSEAQRAELDDGEDEPFGSPPPGPELEWRDKDRYILLRDGDRLVARAGLLETTVTIDGWPYLVAGLGDVLVTPTRRGTGLVMTVVEAAIEDAEGLDAAWLMLFCAAHNVGLYARVGFALIADPVRAQVAAGEVTMPMPAMWRPLRDGPNWPAGEVRLDGPPF